MWVLVALIAPACYGVACIFDSFLSNKNFKNPLVLIFFSCISNILFIPLLFMFGEPTMPPFHLLPIFILLGVINISYLYPYYRGLQNDDTSTTIAFFGIGRIFVPMLAFFIVGEVLSFYQYLGVALIVLSTVLLSVEKISKGVIFSKSLGYIALAAIILSFEGVLLKYLFNRGIPVSTAIAGEMVIPFLISLCLPLFKKIRLEIKEKIPLFLSKVHIFLAEEAFTFFAFTAETNAINLAPVSLVKGATAFTPFFILLYSKILKRQFAGTFKESRSSSLKKILLFSSLVVGVFLILE